MLMLVLMLKKQNGTYLLLLKHNYSANTFKIRTLFDKIYLKERGKHER